MHTVLLRLHPLAKLKAAFSLCLPNTHHTPHTTRPEAAHGALITHLQQCWRPLIAFLPFALCSLLPECTPQPPPVPPWQIMAIGLVGFAAALRPGSMY